MDPAINPFSPGAGLQPPELCGRDELLQDADVRFRRLQRAKPTRGMILLGLRGVGKTVLLNRFQAMAEAYDIKTVRLEAPEQGQLPELLVPELRRILYELDLTAAVGGGIRKAFAALANFAAAFKVKVGEIEFEVDSRTGVADTGNLEQDVPALLRLVAEVARERKTAVCFFLDEMQYLSKAELGALLVSAHALGQAGLPFLLFGAGLPVVAALAGHAKSYAERLFDYPEIAQLDRPSAELAIAHPAQQEGVDFSAEALQEIIEQTECYPYFLQVWASFAWDDAAQNPIGLPDVLRSSQRVVPYLDKNFFRVRFDRLTHLQQKYLRAMAELGRGPYKTGDIALQLGCEPNELSVTRQQLITSGMIWSQRHGETAFTVPMFDGFMRRTIPILTPHIPKRKAR